MLKLATRGHIIDVKRKKERVYKNGGSVMKDENLKIILPEHLRGRSLNTKVIPMLCGLKTMLTHLVELNGDASLLRQGEKRCYKAYCVNEIQDLILESYQEEWPEIMKTHILSKDPIELGASVIDIYLIAYVTETLGVGKEGFVQYIKDVGISTKDKTAKAIWSIGKNDGVYLGLLNSDGTIRDINFFRQWTNTEFVY